MRRRDKAASKTVKTQRRKTLKRRSTAVAARRRKPSAVNATERIARLTRERNEALEQQTATSEVLKVISSLPGELEPVFQSLLENATRVCQAKRGFLFRAEGEGFRVAASLGERADFVEQMKHRALKPGPLTPIGRAGLTRQIVHVPDLSKDRAYLERDPLVTSAVEQGSVRTVLVVPMLKEKELIGAIGMYRDEVQPFTDKQIELLANFAAQAVIAIENTRLLKELRESLQQQTATADVLKAISRSAFDLQTVLDASVESAARLCEADAGIIRRREGDIYPVAAAYGLTGEQRDYFARYSTKPDRGSVFGRAILEGRTVHVPDLLSDPDLDRRRLQDYAGVVSIRSGLGVPLMREGNIVGVFTLQRREPLPFTDKQIELVTTFADQAVIAIENVRLFDDVQKRTRELSESLEQQTATSEVLQVISSSPGDLQMVFDTMLTKAAELCEASYGTMWLREGDGFRAAALHGALPPAFEQRRSGTLFQPGPDTILARIAQTRTPIQVADLRKSRGYLVGDPLVVAGVDVAGIRTLVSVPMVKESELIGVISVYRKEVRPFTDKQIELLANFAAQAVIAIENTRLLKELRQRTDDLSESLEQQTATSEVLKVISSSPGELEPVFETILENATRLCAAKFGNLYLREGDSFRTTAMHNVPVAFAEARRREPVFEPEPGSLLRRLVDTKQAVLISDATKEEAFLAGQTRFVTAVELGGFRSIIAVPMLKEEEVVGALLVYGQEVGTFSGKQIELVTNFAAQAVIAIENTRLLNELRESLQQQTATADVLKVISRSTFELQTALDTLLESAVRLCEARLGALFRLEGDLLHVAAHHNFDDRQQKLLLAKYPMPPNRGHMSGRAVLTGTAIQIPDILTDNDYRSAEAKEAGFRSLLGVPLLRNGQAIGSIVIFRMEVGPFTDKQLELIQTFADQAVIAIENTRLLNEVRESLQQQTATATVLKAVASSSGDLAPVFKAMLENAVRICEAKFGHMFLSEGDSFRVVALESGALPYPDWLKQGSKLALRENPQGPLAQIVAKKKIIHIADLTAETPYIERNARMVALVESSGARTFLGVPMFKDEVLIGVIAIYRQEVRPFTDKQIELVSNFAAQAVIAIENTRLLNELRESLQQQTATADVLKIISRSTFDLRTVLQTLVESAARLCDADKATISREREGAFYRAEAYGFSREFMDYMKDIPIEIERGTASGRALLEGRAVQIADVTADPNYTMVEAQKLGDYRTILAVPMLREGVPIGVLALTRTEVRPFTDKQIELVSTFADQAAIAIENVRLFESVEARTRELAKSLEDLRTAQDRLVQTEKLASLGQLTAGIAHEIKNPLNFVNNFSAVSVELIDELRQALAGAKLDNNLRAEIGEIADMLQGNLDKVVQHGKRADAIVKNMLLHSRQGSAEHRPVDLNNLVEESLNLAYHGARAEKQGFNINLQRSFDPTAGEVDVFPQDVTRVLLNLILNGFYAATKRKAEGNGGDYEPTLTASTKNLGDRVEISIRDNGMGIPPEVKEKLFTPFFTTKPAGEGTGLGLSISHDIVVKQHSGSIEVDTKPGEFTEFRIILPRTAASGART